MVAVACFLPGRAKDLSALRHILYFTKRTGAKALTLMKTKVTHPLITYNKYAATFLIIQIRNQRVIKTI